MKELLRTPMQIAVFSCILIQGTKASKAKAGVVVNNSEPNNDSPDLGENERNTNIHRSSNESDATSQTTSSSFTSASSTNDSGNISNEDSKHESTGHSAYYYNNNQNNDSQRINAKYDDEQTYLDVFGERAKELFTQHIIPSTDVECLWDWRMGRCEPYCLCGFQFLWGDFHVGRSCRLRSNPPPSQFEKGEAAANSEEEVEETHWQEAWQEVWQSQMTEGTVDDASNFVPPLFLKSHPSVVEDASSCKASTMCTLPPESRYIQIIRQLTTNSLTHSTIVIDQYQKLKNVALNAANTTVIQCQHQWATLRQKACETVKNKVEERAKVRDQPVVLTRQGATWIRRVCSASDGSIWRVNDNQIDCRDGVDNNHEDDDEKKIMEDIAEDELE